jgi:RNA polymerase sigma factor
MDEYSIGLAAFNEAINQFQARKASSFLSFAYVVVRRRVIDFLRKEASQRKVLFFGQLNSLEENIQEEASLPQLKRAIQFFEMRSQNEKLADEIYEYQKILEGYDISFNHLIKQCPKQIDARQRAVMIAKTIAENEELSVYLCKKKKLPLKDLLTKVPYSRKTIERHRSYIVALALVYIGRFTGLKSYTQFV